MSGAWRKVKRSLPAEVRLLLSDTLAQYRLIGLLGAVAVLGAAWLWVGMLFMGLDWIWALPAGMRSILRLVWLSSGLAAALAVLVRRFAPRHPVRWALYLEELAGGMGGELATSVELALRPRPHPFAAFLSSRVQERVRGMSRPPELPASLLRFLLKVLIPAVVLCVLWLAVGQERFVRGVARLLLPQRPTPPPSRLVLTDVRPGDTVLPVGERLAASCELDGKAEEDVFLVYEPEGAGGVERIAASRSGTRFQAESGPLEESGGYYFEMPGKTASAAYRVRVLDPPEVSSVRFRIQPQQYTGRLAYEMGPDAAALEGSLVAVEVMPSRRALGGRLVLDSGEEVALEASAEGLSGEFTAWESTSYTVSFTDAYGFQSLPFPKHQVSVKKDRAPEVRLVSPGGGEVLEGEDVPVEIDVAEDYGLRRLYVSTRAAGVAAGRGTEAEGGRAFAVSLEPKTGRVGGIVPGSIVRPAGSDISLTPVAVDNCPFRDQETRGASVTLKVVKELTAEPPPPERNEDAEKLEQLVGEAAELLDKASRPMQPDAKTELERMLGESALRLQSAAGGIADDALAEEVRRLAGEIRDPEKRANARGTIERIRRMLAPQTRQIEADVEPPPPDGGGGEAPPLPPDRVVEQLPDPADLSRGYRKLLEVYRSLLLPTRRDYDGEKQREGRP